MRSARASSTDDEGFTIVELVVAIGLAAFLFSALASVMVASLSAVGVQKSRTQGNDIATIGIEDLQRLRYNSLGLCAAPSGAPPPAMADTVLLANCAPPAPATPPTKYAPCAAGAQPSNSVPSEEYTCVRRAIRYVVRRFIAYGDVAHTEKRLAVVVDWIDEGGKHRVAQQSSLRIPSQNAVIGLAPPQIVTGGGTSVAPSSISLNPDGTTATSLTLRAETTGLDASAGDTVSAVFETVGGTGRQQQSITLGPDTPASTNWTGALAIGQPGFKFGPGSQFVTFTATRVKDGKVNSRVYFPALDVVGTTPFMPSVFVSQQPPPNVLLDGQGDLLAPFSIEVTTSNVSPADSVTATFETQTGAVSLSMRPLSFTGSCNGLSPCDATWTLTVEPSSGYHFVPGTRYLYVTARQVPAPGVYPVDGGATAAVRSSPIAFA